MAIKVLVNGAFGKMGQMTCATLTDNPKFELVGQTGRDYNLQQAITDSGADVVIDFTEPNAAYQNTLTIIAAGARPIIGTTGLKLDQIGALQEKCAAAKLGGIIAPNFSMGAVLMMKCAKEIAKYMPDVEVVEMHHTEKMDSPSGTAVRTAEILAAARGENGALYQPANETVQGARGATYRGIPIHAIRLPGFLAHEQVIFGAMGETLTIRHDTIDRQSFMPGICLACEKVMTLKQMVYGLENIV